MTNAAAERVAATEHAFGASEIAVRDCASDRTRGNWNAVERDGLDDIDREIVTLPELAKDVDVTCSATTKAMIVSDDELAQGKALEQDPPDELRSV
jgi:hypothetical protein